MSGCAIRRWGPGSGYTRPQNTEAVREAEAALAAMKAERERQDVAFGQQQPASESKKESSVERPNRQNGVL